MPFEILRPWKSEAWLPVCASQLFTTHAELAGCTAHGGGSGYGGFLGGDGLVWELVIVRNRCENPRNFHMFLWKDVRRTPISNDFLYGFAGMKIHVHPFII